MPEGVEGYSANAVVFEFVCYVGSLDSEVSGGVSATAERSTCSGANKLSSLLWELDFNMVCKLLSC